MTVYVVYITHIHDIPGNFYVELLFDIYKSTGPMKTNFELLTPLNYYIIGRIKFIVVSFFVCDADWVGFS